MQIFIELRWKLGESTHKPRGAFTNAQVRAPKKKLRVVLEVRAPLESKVHPLRFSRHISYLLLNFQMTSFSVLLHLKPKLTGWI